MNTITEIKLLARIIKSFPLLSEAGRLYALRRFYTRAELSLVLREKIQIDNATLSEA